MSPSQYLAQSPYSARGGFVLLEKAVVNGSQDGRIAYRSVVDGTPIDDRHRVQEPESLDLGHKFGTLRTHALIGHIEVGDRSVTAIAATQFLADDRGDLLRRP